MQLFGIEVLEFQAMIRGDLEILSDWCHEGVGSSIGFTMVEMFILSHLFS